MYNVTLTTKKAFFSNVMLLKNTWSYNLYIGGIQV